MSLIVNRYLAQDLLFVHCFIFRNFLNSLFIYIGNHFDVVMRSVATLITIILFRVIVIFIVGIFVVVKVPMIVVKVMI